MSHHVCELQKRDTVSLESSDPYYGSAETTILVTAKYLPVEGQSHRVRVIHHYVDSDDTMLVARLDEGVWTEMRVPSRLLVEPHVVIRSHPVVDSAHDPSHFA